MNRLIFVVSSPKNLGSFAINGPERRILSMIVSEGLDDYQIEVVYPNYGKLVFPARSNLKVHIGGIKHKLDFRFILFLFKSIKNWSGRSIIHVQGPPSLDFMAVIFGVIKGYRVIVTRPLSLEIDRYSNILKFLMKFIDWVSLKLSGAIIVQNSEMFSNYIRLYGQRKVHLVYNGVLNSQNISFTRPTSDLLNIFYTAQFVDRKNHEFIVELAEYMLLRGFCNFRFTLIGGGPNFDKIAELVLDKRLEQYIVLTGLQENPRSLYNGLSIYFSPSLLEGMSVACLEALSVGMPIVAFEAGGMNEIIEHGVTGFLLSHDQIASDNLKESCFNYILTLGNVERYLEFSKKAMLRFNVLFSFETYLIKHKDLYEKEV